MSEWVRACLTGQLVSYEFVVPSQLVTTRDLGCVQVRVVSYTSSSSSSSSAFDVMTVLNPQAGGC